MTWPRAPRGTVKVMGSTQHQPIVRPTNPCPITIKHDPHVWDEPPFSSDRGQQCPGVIHPANKVFCPFNAPSYDCPGGCPNNRERACVNGE